jgi:retron-type reverse transcriptase
MGNDSIDLGLGNVWKAWTELRKGKRVTEELHIFQYYLEENLYVLHKELNDGTYRHGPYKCFTVCENKKREISVAPIRDRVVHRLLYDFLMPIWDKTFIYDAWSCRKNKGLLGAIERAQFFLKKYPRFFIWRGDVSKFFDSVDHSTLLTILSRRIKDERAYALLKEVIESFVIDKSGGGGYVVYLSEILRVRSLPTFI